MLLNKIFVPRNGEYPLRHGSQCSPFPVFYARLVLAAYRTPPTRASSSCHPACSKAPTRTPPSLAEAEMEQAVATRRTRVQWKRASMASESRTEAGLDPLRPPPRRSPRPGSSSPSLYRFESPVGRSEGWQGQARESASEARSHGWPACARGRSPVCPWVRSTAIV